jgi:hypothetical protein
VHGKSSRGSVGAERMRHELVQGFAWRAVQTGHAVAYVPSVRHGAARRVPAPHAASLGMTNDASAGGLP